MTEPLRLAVTMSRFPKLTETFVLNEILALDDRGVEVEVFPLLRERQTVVHEAARPVVGRAHFTPFLNRAILASNARALRSQPRAYLGTLARLLRETWRSPNFVVGGLGIFPKAVHIGDRLQALGVEHLHCHFATHPAVAGWIVRRLTGITYSFTAHGSDLHVDRRMLPTKVAEAAFVATVSEYNRRLIVEECAGRHADKVHVVRCGVDTTVFTPRPPRPVRSRPHLVCIGTLHEVKGQRHLLEACARLGDGLGRCTLIGDGPDEAMLRALARSLGIEDRVRFAGACPREVVAAKLADADVLVAPSVPTRSGKREGIPVVLIEAMASSVPVIASDLSGIPELVLHEQTGLLAPPGDTGAIADAVRRLCDEPNLAARLAANALEHVRAEFALDTNVSRLLTHVEASARGGVA